MGVGVAGEDGGSDGGFERAAAPVVRGDSGAVREGRSGAAESSAGSAAVEGDGAERATAADLVGVCNTGEGVRGIGICGLRGNEAGASVFNEGGEAVAWARAKLARGGRRVGHGGGRRRVLELDSGSAWGRRS